MPKFLFPLGRIVATPGALTALAQAEEEPKKFLSRHQNGDWGNLAAFSCGTHEAKMMSSLFEGFDKK